MTHIQWIMPPPPPPLDRAYQRWTAEEVAELISRLTGGDATQDIAQAHGRSEGAIRSRIAQLYNEGQLAISSAMNDPEEDDCGDDDEEYLPPPARNILIIGAGGIGGLLTHHVARAAAFSGLTELTGILRLTLMDGDVVEERNLPHQPFSAASAKQEYHGALDDWDYDWDDDWDDDWEEDKVQEIKDVLVTNVGVTSDRGVQIVAIAEDFTAEIDVSKYDLVVVAVDREEPRRLVHENAKQWLDLRARGDGFVMCSHETDPRVLASLPSLPDDESASCQLEDAVETGNIQFGFALAAAHGAQWIVQWLRDSNVPSSQMYTIHMGELPLPEFPKEEVE